MHNRYSCLRLSIGLPTSEFSWKGLSRAGPRFLVGDNASSCFRQGSRSSSTLFFRPLPDGSPITLQNGHGQKIVIRDPLSYQLADLLTTPREIWPGRSTPASLAPSTLRHPPTCPATIITAATMDTTMQIAETAAMMTRLDLSLVPRELPVKQPPSTNNNIAGSSPSPSAPAARFSASYSSLTSYSCAQMPLSNP